MPWVISPRPLSYFPRPLKTTSAFSQKSDLGGTHMCMLSISTYFHFQPGPYGQTIAGGLFPADPEVIFFLPVPVSIPLVALTSSPSPLAHSPVPWKQFPVLCDHFDSQILISILKQARLNQAEAIAAGTSLWSLLPNLGEQGSWPAVEWQLGFQDQSRHQPSSKNCTPYLLIQWSELPRNIPSPIPSIFFLLSWAETSLLSHQRQGSLKDKEE